MHTCLTNINQSCVLLLELTCLGSHAYTHTLALARACSVCYLVGDGYQHFNAIVSAGFCSLNHCTTFIHKHSNEPTKHSISLAQFHENPQNQSIATSAFKGKCRRTYNCYVSNHTKTSKKSKAGMHATNT